MQVVYAAVLWKYHTLKNGEHTVKIRIANFKNTEYISTEMSCHPDNWDEANGVPKPSHPQFSKLVKKIQDIKDDIDFELKLADKNDELISIKELKERVDSKLKKKPGEQIKVQKLFEYYDGYIKQLEAQDRIGYANVFISNKSFIQKCIGETDKPFPSITDKDFKKIEQAIFKLKSESTKSNYLRTFYRLWNEAIKDKVCPEKHHPKFHINFKAYKRIKTKKRAISTDYLKEIFKLRYAYESRLFRSQKYAIFCYYTRGINFNDMAKLKKENIKNGYLKYKRSKNKREYHFKLHPKALKIVELFEQYPMKSDANYIFPILDRTHDTAKKIDVRIDSALKDFNEDLAVFETKVKSPKHITSYTLRHSFASALRKKKVPILFIKEAMGHETEEQANVYMEEIDDSEVTEIIEEALD